MSTLDSQRGTQIASPATVAYGYYWAQAKPVLRITSGDIWVEAVSCRHWDDQFQAFKRFEGKREYVVSWIDCFASGASAGRGILHAARHEEEAPGAESLQLGHQALPNTFLGVFPKSSMWHFLKIFNNRAGMRLVNFAKHQSGKMFEHGKSSRQSLADR